MPDSDTMVEYGIISGDTVIGDRDTRNVTEPHRHNYEKIFLFLGTDKTDTADLGCEVEFWVGEGDDLEKIILTTSSSIYIPAERRPLPADMAQGAPAGNDGGHHA